MILQTGDEAMRCLQAFAVQKSIGGAQITAIGAFSGAKLAFFGWESKQYRPIAVAQSTMGPPLYGAVEEARQPLRIGLCEGEPYRQDLRGRGELGKSGGGAF